jgi:DNA polymerase-3 subunit delta
LELFEMARVSPQELLSRIEKGKVIPAIVLMGEEPFLRDACRARLIEKYVPEASRTWAVSRYSAVRGETEAALSQAQSLPMLAPQQVIFLEDAGGIEKLGEKNREETVALIENYLSDPAPFTVLVIEAARLDERMKLAKVLAAKALVVEVGLGENPEQRQGAAVMTGERLAAEMGLSFERGALEDLADRVAADLQRLKTEMEKLANYVGERKKITREDVAAMVASERATTTWDLVDLLTARQSKKALEFLDRLLRDGEEPLMMLGAMTWIYRKVIEASEMKGAMNGWQASRTLGMRPEQAELAIRAAEKASKAELLAGLSALEKADERLKSSTDARTVMEFLVVELTGGKAVGVGR